MAVCKRCIVPDSHPGVTLENGLCSFCRVHDRSPRLDKTPLGKDKLLAKLTSKHVDKYHCVVPLSGGKDSCYVVLYVVKQLGLKPLAVTVDSGFMADAAKKNVETICRKLTVDLVIHKTRFVGKLTRESFHIWKSSGPVISPCTPCERNNRSVAINQAIRRKIPFIVWGATDYEDDASTFLDPHRLAFRQRYANKGDETKRHVRAIVWDVLSDMGFWQVRAALKSLPPDKKLRTAFHIAKYMYYSFRNNLDVGVPERWRRCLPFVETSFENKHVETIYFFDYIPYSPLEFMKALKEEVGWEAPVSKETRLDCKLHCIPAYQSLREAGITSDGLTFSVLVRYGLMSREEAEQRERVIKETLEKDCEDVLGALGFDKEGIIS